MVYLTIKGIESEFIEILPNTLMYNKFYHDFYVVNLWEANKKKPTFLFRHENVRIIDFKIKVTPTLDIILIFLKQSLDSSIYTLNINYFKAQTTPPSNYSLDLSIKLTIPTSPYTSLQILSTTQPFPLNTPIYTLLYTSTDPNPKLIQILLKPTKSTQITQADYIAPTYTIYRKFSAVLIGDSILYIASVSVGDNVPAISLYDIGTGKSFYFKRLFEEGLSLGNIQNILCMKEEGGVDGGRGKAAQGNGKNFLGGFLGFFSQNGFWVRVFVGLEGF
jgi:hypothetical protein